MNSNRHQKPKTIEKNEWIKASCCRLELVIFQLLIPCHQNWHHILVIVALMLNQISMFHFWWFYDGNEWVCQNCLPMERWYTHILYAEHFIASWCFILSQDDNILVLINNFTIWGTTYEQQERRVKRNQNLKVNSKFKKAWKANCLLFHSVFHVFLTVNKHFSCHEFMIDDTWELRVIRDRFKLTRRDQMTHNAREWFRFWCM